MPKFISLQPVSLLFHVCKSLGIVSCCSGPVCTCPSFVHNPALKRPCYAPHNMWCVCQHYPTCHTSNNPKPPKLLKTESTFDIEEPILTNESTFNNLPLPSIVVPPPADEDQKGTRSEINSDLDKRRESLLSEGGCGGMQCACSSDETTTAGSRRCSEVSCLECAAASQRRWSGRSEMVASAEAIYEVTDANEKTPESSPTLVVAEKDDLINKESNKVEESVEKAALGRKGSEDASVTTQTTGVEDINLSIKSEDSDAVSELLANNDALSTLLRNRFKKYDSADLNLEGDSDRISLTSSLKVEHDSVTGDITVNDNDSQFADETSKLLEDSTSACDKEDKVSECVSLSADEMADDTTSKASKDMYSKLEIIRQNKRSAEPQHSMNNLLVSDSGSEQMSMRQRSESSLSATFCSEDTTSKSSRRTKDFECTSQINSEDSTSFKSRPPKDYESISQTPTTDIADLDNINEVKKSKKLAKKSKTLSLRKRKGPKMRLASSLRGPPSAEGTGSIVSTNSSTSRAPVKCCCLVS